MDPQQTWADLIEAVKEANWEEAADIAADLTGWLDRGGFPPKITGCPVFDKIAALKTSEAISAWDV
jgi:hypothetical protein